MAFSVSALTAYVKENQDVLVKDVVLGQEGGDTIGMFSKQMGVKSSERLHPLSVSPSLQSATTCGFSAEGNTVISERLIETAQAKINDSWCEEDLLGKFAEYDIEVQAGSEKLPFEAEIMGEYGRGINKEVEEQIWVGNKSNSARTDLVNGLITIAKGADSASTITGTTASGTSAYALIKATLMAIPEEIADEAVIYVSPAIFREYIQDLVSANLYHYDPSNGAMEDFFIPGSNVKVHKTYGLKGTNYAYATAPKNIVYGADLLNAKEEFKVWFSDDNDETRLKVRFNFGVQTLFPDVVVLYERA